MCPGRQYPTLTEHHQLQANASVAPSRGCSIPLSGQQLQGTISYDRTSGFHGPAPTAASPLLCIGSLGLKHCNVGFCVNESNTWKALREWCWVGPRGQERQTNTQNMCQFHQRESLLLPQWKMSSINNLPPRDMGWLHPGGSALVSVAGRWALVCEDLAQLPLGGHQFTGCLLEPVECHSRGRLGEGI